MHFHPQAGTVNRGSDVIGAGMIVNGTFFLFRSFPDLRTDETFISPSPFDFPSTRSFNPTSSLHSVVLLSFFSSPITPILFITILLRLHQLSIPNYHFSLRIYLLLRSPSLRYLISIITINSLSQSLSLIYFHRNLASSPSPFANPTSSLLLSPAPIPFKPLIASIQQ